MLGLGAQPVSYFSLGLTAVTGAALVWYYNRMMSEKVQKGAALQ